MKKRKGTKWILIWAILLVVLPPAIGYLFKGREIFSSVAYYFTYTSIGYVYGIIFPLGNSIIGKYFDKLNWEKNPKRINLITFMVFMGFAIIMGILIPYTIDRFLWGMSGKDVFYDVMAKAFMITVISLVIFYFYNTTLISNNWIRSIEKNEELKRENLLARYEALKNQVNPHFLFNSLNTLSGVVEHKPELAADFIKKLSDIYRYILEQSDNELVSLHNEMKFVMNYIFLSKMRFGESLVFNSELSTSNNILIVPLGLQMLIENAIKHNVISDKKPLIIDMKIEDGFIVVKNNLQKKNTISSEKEPLGMENLKKRYAYLSNVSVEVIESDKTFVVKLPIIEA